MAWQLFNGLPSHLRHIDLSTQARNLITKQCHLATPLAANCAGQLENLFIAMHSASAAWATIPAIQQQAAGVIFLASGIVPQPSVCPSLLQYPRQVSSKAYCCLTDAGHVLSSMPGIDHHNILILLSAAKDPAARLWCLRASLAPTPVIVPLHQACHARLWTAGWAVFRCQRGPDSPGGSGGGSAARCQVRLEQGGYDHSRVS